MSAPAQRLKVLPTEYVVEHMPGEMHPAADTWLCLVRVPEGLTVVRPARSDDPIENRWAGVYGESAHALDAPGMLAALIDPLADAGLPVFVASTYHAAVLLVPRPRRDEAFDVLRGACHEIDDG